MDLAQVFYVIGIIAGVTWLITLTALGIAGYLIYQKYKQLKSQATELKEKIKNMRRHPLETLGLARHLPWKHMMPLAATPLAATAAKWLWRKVAKF